MFQRLISYYQNTVHPWEYSHFFSPFSKKKGKAKEKLRIAFCGVFPPFQNGAAAGMYYIIKELAKHPEIELFLIPIKRKIDKKLFSDISLKFTTVTDSTLDIIIFWCLGDDFEKYAAGAITKKIAWQTMHNDPKTNLREQQTFDAIKQADLILATTQWAAGCYKKQTPRVDYLPCGVDPLLFAAAKQKKETFTCLFVSRIHYYKGIMPFLDAIPFVLEKEKEVYFDIVAPMDKNSPYLQEISQKIKELKQKYYKNIHLKLNWLSYEKIPALYQEASVLIFPSNNEGFGIPLIEAMSAEVPCIVLDKKPMSEIIVHKKTGFCLSPLKEKEKYHNFAFPNPKDIAEKILFLKKNPKKLEEMGEEARKRVMNYYALPDVINNLIKHCQNLAEKKGEI